MGKRKGSFKWFWCFVTGVWLSLLGAVLKAPERILPMLGERELVYEFSRDTTKLPWQEDISESDYTRRTVTFPSQGTTIEAWLYLPLTKPAPVIIMGHGLGSQKDMGLHPYAEQFAQAGMAVLVIDYRGFGGSDGLPRHHISWHKHLEDYQAALDWVHSGQLDSQEIDASRIALWGVSYSGAHALMTAAKEGYKEKVTAVVANEPFLTGDGNIGKAIKERGPLKVARLVFAATIDKARELFGLDAIYVKLVGTFDDLALLNMHKEDLLAARGGHALGTPKRMGGWKNLATPRMIFDYMHYKPLIHVHKIQCPTLLVGGTKDVITPMVHIEEAHRLIGPKAQLVAKPYGHIELHRVGMQPQELAPVVDFLRLHLSLKPFHVETHPHEEEKDLEATSSEVV